MFEHPYILHMFIDQPLTSQEVEQMMEAETNKQLRSLLNEKLPTGPEGKGWADVDQWTVKELILKKQPGQLGLLPLHHPAPSPSPLWDEFDDYAMWLFSEHLPHYIRDWSTTTS